MSNAGKFQPSNHTQEEIEWEERRVQGLVFFVDKNDPTHLKLLDRAHSRKVWIEVWTNSKQPVFSRFQTTERIQRPAL